jgi:acetolactate synthase-1/2/3 large subunit
MLAQAERPLVVIGAGCREHSTKIRRLVDKLNVPFVTTPRAKGLVSELHPYSLRNGGLAASLWARRYTAQPVDVALALGTDLDDSSMGPTPYLGAGGRLIHVDVDATVFNRNLPTALGIQGDVGAFAADLSMAWIPSVERTHRTRQLVDEARKESAFDAPNHASDPRSPVAPHRVVADLQAAAGSGARFITDIGEHMLFALHYLVAEGPDDFHIQLNLGSMGSGIAGATGLALGDPTRRVVCICGDGGMQMAGMEVLTSLRERLPIVYAVFNDGRYNMVHHGMKQIFGEAAPHDAPWVDFAAWAASLGVPAATITRAGEITEALLDELLSDRKPAVLDIRVDRDVRIRGGGRVEALQHMSMLSEHTAKLVTS